MPKDGENGFEGRTADRASPGTRVLDRSRTHPSRSRRLFELFLRNILFLRTSLFHVAMISFCPPVDDILHYFSCILLIHRA